MGGSHLSVLGLLQRLDRDRFDPLVVVPREDGKIARLFREENIPVVSPFGWTATPHARNVGLNGVPAALAKLVPQVRFLRGEEIDITHINDGRTQAAWSLAAKLAGTRLLWHHRGNPDSRGLRFVAPLLADRVLSVSQFSLPRGGLISAAGRAQVVHSPFDTDIAVDRAAARAMLTGELRAPPDALLLGYFGVFQERKRPLLFIDAVARLRELRPDLPVRGLMFGAAEESIMDDAIRRHIRGLELDEHIVAMGWRSPGTTWIAACDQLIVPAVGEPFGRTLVEAMLVGTPVVATRSGGNVEALDNGRLGILVPPEDADALARGILELARDGGHALAARARDSARHRFGLDRHCDQVMAVYEAMLA
ncbi:glycosyltransferase family 4 protein [Stakelama saccharophila]|uniref:Glycosyltransferase family 4 protein n=1 Tax=Stakelama saccharophila TaxID=3075605 RepID=A0ABZ0BAG7_9SPHN|nr:glycosyltransferase family 4 protein [Stakelama sp. W311]WNO54197.1 glycosyltransferase family 4 protein [Stakelama sp. W311]